MNIRAIIEKYLKDNGYDGLHSESCGCELSDLMPCDFGSCAECMAGYRHERGAGCKNCVNELEACIWCIKPEKGSE